MARPARVAVGAEFGTGLFDVDASDYKINANDTAWKLKDAYIEFADGTHAGERPHWLPSSQQIQADQKEFNQLLNADLAKSQSAQAQQNKPAQGTQLSAAAKIAYPNNANPFDLSRTLSAFAFRSESDEPVGISGFRIHFFGAPEQSSIFTATGRFGNPLDSVDPHLILNNKGDVFFGYILHGIIEPGSAEPIANKPIANKGAEKTHMAKAAHYEAQFKSHGATIERQYGTLSQLQESQKRSRELAEQKMKDHQLKEAQAAKDKALQANPATKP